MSQQRHLTESTRPLPPIDYSLMGQQRPPIAGPGSEVAGGISGWCWCGYCGYTGRVLGPTQAACPERHGWHAWLAQCADFEIPFPTREQREEEAA